MFFEGARGQFFRPLNSKYREVVAACIAQLYRRQFTSLADYGQSLSRQQITDIFTDAVVRSEHVFVDDDELVASDPRKLGGWIFQQLRETGWIEERADAISMTSSFGLSGIGRNFAHAFCTDHTHQVRTHHRNTRNTRNALKGFASTGDVHDLLDAVEHSERIVADFSDVIVELEERRNQLIHEVQQHDDIDQAAEYFFEFMEKRFEPDLAVRLSADSVERYRDEILSIIREIRKQPKARRLDIERRLRALKLAGFSESDIWYDQLLRMIESRLRNACEIMLPSLRDALTNFTQRADAIIRQLSQLGSKSGVSVSDTLAELRKLPEAERTRRLASVSSAFGNYQVALVDPAQVRPFKRRQVERVHSEKAKEVMLSEQEQKALFVKTVLENAFSVSDRDIRAAFEQACVDTSSSSSLRVSSVSDFLMATQVVSMGANVGSDVARYEVTATDEIVGDEFFLQRDVFKFSKVE